MTVDKTVDKTFDKHVMFCELSQRLDQALELNLLHKKEIEKLENKILLLENIIFKLLNDEKNI